MIEILSFLQKLRDNSGAVWLHEDSINLSVPVSMQNEQTRQFVDANKTELVMLLRDNAIISIQDFLRTTVFCCPNFLKYPLSMAQERLWFIEEYEQGTNVYHLPYVYRLDKSAFKEGFVFALQEIVKRHEILRTFITRDDDLGTPFQTVQREPLFVDDININKDDFHNLLLVDINRPFDLTKEYPIRAKFYSVNNPSPDCEVFLLLNLHHIAFDGWSIDILKREIFFYYEAFIKKEFDVILPPLEIQYKDYALYQKSYLTGDGLQKQLSYWKDKLSGFQSLELPLDFPRPARFDYRGSTELFVVPKEVSYSLRRLAQELGSTLNSVLLSSVKILLGRFAGQQDVVIGSAIANRHLRQTESLIGFFVNMQINRSILKSDETFAELVRQVHQDQVEAQVYQDLPFGTLVHELGIDRDISRHPVFQVMFLLQSFGRIEKNTDTEKNYLSLLEIENSFEVEKFDLTFSIDDSEEQFTGSISYATSLFTSQTIKALIQQYLHLLSSLAQDAERVYSQLSLLSADEFTSTIKCWNNTWSDYGREKRVCDLFVEQAFATPSAVAVFANGQQLSFGQLNERSNQLAWHLRKRFIERTGKELRADTLIGLFVDRGLETIVSILGILKAGAAYVPIDTSFPQDRVKYILDDTKAQLVVTQKHLLLTYSLNADTVVIADLDDPIYQHGKAEDLPPFSGADDVAYIIYTSGTTGHPKGVMISHASLSNFIAGMSQVLPLQSNDHLLAITSISFDISILELLWTLTRGMAITIKSSHASINHFDRYLNTQTPQLDFSLFYFSSQASTHHDKYAFLKDSATFADQNGFSAIWLPERHFHQFGGIFPNPSVLAAALSTITQKIELRSGSVVLPLHDVIRTAEEWAVVDNLSNGRVGLSIASGWHANDFVLQPDHYDQRHRIMYEQIGQLLQLWKGQAITRLNGAGQPYEVTTFPRPVNENLPIYITSAGNRETFITAGKTGAHLLTHLLGQDLEELAENIRLYKEALRENGHAPAKAKIALMLHTYIGEDLQTVREVVREPFKEYLRSSVGLIQSLAKDVHGEASLDDHQFNDLLEFAFERYWQTSALMGTPQSCQGLLHSLYQIGVTEIACLVDFGIDEQTVLKGLENLSVFKNQFSRTDSTDPTSRPVTAIQITPSYLEALLEDPESRAFIQSLKYIIAGGEKFPEELLARLTSVASSKVYNMYGPTETTIWSSYSPLTAGQPVSIGKPIQNTRIYILDQFNNLCPQGVVGEICIAGDGLACGYLNNPELTRAKFIELTLPIDSGATSKERLYKTGDLGRWRADGSIEYLGRTDDQIKIRGHRVELSEIENTILQIKGIKQCCVVVKSKSQSAQTNYLVAYYIPTDADAIAGTHIAEHLTRFLPEYMIPAVYMPLQQFPLKSTGKLDKKALPDPLISHQENTYTPPKSELQGKACEIWQQALELERVGITDDFFAIGGNSILAIQVSHMMSKKLDLDIKVADLFRQKSIDKLLNSSSLNYQFIQPFAVNRNSELDDLIFLPSGGGGSEEYYEIASRLADKFNCIGIENFNLNNDKKMSSLSAIASFYLSQLEKFAPLKNHINLVGWSFGGLTALQIAWILETRGIQNIRVFLLDTLISDNYIREEMSKINFDEVITDMRKQMAGKFAEMYIDKLCSNFKIQKQLDNQTISGNLKKTKVTLFRAVVRTSEDQYSSPHLKDHIESLTFNNIEKVCENLKVINVDCTHFDILKVSIAEIVEIISDSVQYFPQDLSPALPK